MEMFCASMVAVFIFKIWFIDWAVVTSRLASSMNEVSAEATASGENDFISESQP